MKNTMLRGDAVKKAPGEFRRAHLQMEGNKVYDLMKSLKKGEILRLRDDFRPFLKIRCWLFQDLFNSGGIFLHHQDGGFMEVKKEDIDWQEYKNRTIPDPNLANKP